MIDALFIGSADDTNDRHHHTLIPVKTSRVTLTSLTPTIMTSSDSLYSLLVTRFGN